MALSATKKKRLLLALMVTLLVPLGLATKIYKGPGAVWVQGSGGAILYEVFWIAFFQLLFVRSRTWIIAAAVFGATCLIELAQLWDASFLVAARETLPGRLLLGSNGGFDPLDFPHYLVGSLFGLLVCFRLRASIKDR